MLSIIKENLLRKDLILKSKSILCAVSGGVDSMVMLDCLMKLNIKVAVVHIDHNTRNGESKTDMQFVESICHKIGVKFHKATFNSDNISISNFQEKARIFRYKTFKTILSKNDYAYVATAHHLDDDFETFIINLTRGTGIKGLTGIPFHNDFVIRPLNSISKLQIKDYAKENQINFVNDISNDNDGYLRNEIRHHVIPAINDLNHHALNGFQSTISHLKTTSTLLTKLVTEKYISRSKFNNLIVTKNNLPTDQHGVTILHIAFGSFGFNSVQLKDILTSRSGKKISYKNWSVYNDRHRFVLIQQKAKIKGVFINKVGEYILDDGRRIKISYTDKDGIGFLSKPFPFVVRCKKDGDKFKPEGMNGKSKSLKKFISDLKLNIEDKQRILILEKDSEIRSVLGFRNSQSLVQPKFYIKVDIQ